MDDNRKIGDVEKVEAGPLGMASGGRTYALDFNPDNGMARELVWQDETGSHPRQCGVAWIRLVEIGEWKKRIA